MTAMFQALIDQAAQDAQIIASQQRLLQTQDVSLQAKDVKIAALTHELAYYKRIRFSAKTEALAPLQRDVFEETWNTDLDVGLKPAMELPSPSNSHPDDDARNFLDCHLSSEF